MRRQTIGPWESEAGDTSERLRMTLAMLLEQERVLFSGAVDNEKFLEALQAADRTKGVVDEWWQEWRLRTADVKTSRGVVLSVFRGCLPVLLGAVDVYCQSLAIFAISHDLDSGDRDLAGRGVRAAKDASSYALQFLDDIPALRPVDRAAVDATLAGLETRSKVMRALMAPIGRRLGELRAERG